MQPIKRYLMLVIGFIIAWQGIIICLSLPSYILPSPYAVLSALYHHRTLLCHELLYTLSEIVLGLLIAIILGCIASFIMAYSKPTKQWILPLLIVSQAVPTFAIAPLFVIWLGYGVSAKIAITVIMLFFPITSSFLDGLLQVNSEWIALADTMQAKKWRLFWLIKMPAALPRLASGIRVAAVFAPMGAIIGEWVGASHGLGFLMLNANARMQIDMMFATLVIIVTCSFLLYAAVNKTLNTMIHWQDVTL